MMKIAFCTDGIFPHAVGGMQRHSRLLIEELMKHNIKITVFHPHSGKTIFGSNKNITEVYIKGIDKEKNYLKETYKYSKRIFNHLVKMPEYIVYSQGLSVWYGIKKLPNKIIVNPHGLEPYQAINFKNKIIAIPFKTIFNYIFKHADKVVSLGGKLTHILETVISDNSKIVVLPNGVNLVKTNLEAEKKDTPIQMLFVGRFASNKGIDILLEVVSELNKEGVSQKIHYKLAGKGPLWAALKSQYKFNNVDFLGFVSDEQLNDLYLQSHCFVLPTLFEGMPTVVLEAMANQLPVIVTDVGATAELVDKSNGYLIPRNDKEALKEAIKNFVNKSQAERGVLAKNSLTKVKEKFSWNIVAERHIDIFSKLYDNIF